MRRSRRQNLCHQSGFDPRFVPEVAAGYWWHAERTSGFGTTAFRVLEGNGHSTFDLVQATVASQPTLLTENGGKQFRMRKSIDANPSTLATAATVQAGWTGPTYVGMWVRVPDAAGDVTSTVSLLSHSLTTGNQRRLNWSLLAGTPDQYAGTVSDDGLLHATYNPRTTSPSNGNWQYLEYAIDIGLSLGGASPGSVLKLLSNLVNIAFTTVPTGAPLVVFNALAQIFVACQTTGANSDTTDWAACYYANGIPTLANRKLLANTSRPLAVAFS